MQLNVDNHNMQHNYNNNMAFFQNWSLDICNSIIHQNDNITIRQSESKMSSLNFSISSFQEAALNSSLLTLSEDFMINYETAAMTSSASQNLNDDLESAVNSEMSSRDSSSLYLNSADLDTLLSVNLITHDCIDDSLFRSIDAEIDVIMQNLMNVIDALSASAIFELA
ncbi:hypothetical protein EMCG_05758 [[Emmonsia] crescens]|uniref:Uncharacterized protein n=1 Tax=[Emmonsia] crescens TaxID=73230 RepID=A0A0G2IE97_9EURO|nr:hypothetical protein EMCG_05758 [Emmonsia crescens UAMH 3008]